MRSTQLGPKSPRFEVSRSRTIRHKHPLEILWRSGQSVPVAANYTKHNKHKRITSMPSAGFEPAIPTKPLQPYALNLRATRIGLNIVIYTS